VTNLLTTHLLRGDNLLAVEVHQVAVTSSDVVFGLALQAVPRTSGAVLTDQRLPRQAVDAGTDVVFHVPTAGQPPLTYQWRFNGTDLPGQTNPVLTLPEVTLSRQGFYSVRVRNEFGPADSPPSA